MAISGKFIADFDSFNAAVQKAETQLKSFESGAGKTQTALNKMVDSFSGRKVISDATLMASAVERVGGVSKLTAAEQAALSAKVSEAIEKFNALGKQAPDSLIKIANATANATASTSGFAAGLTRVVEAAAGFVTAQAILDLASRAVHALGSEIVALTTHGAEVADVSENFDHLATQSGRLGSTLIGALREGTHGTIDNFTLMKTASADLAAGLNLTDAQFATVAKGAFALAKATGVDTVTALNDMNEALLKGNAKQLASLTGKIDLAKAEEQFAHSLGVTMDHLSAEGKLQAAREAILKRVAEVTQRLGEQTEGLDEKVAQARTSWTNFQNELGKTIATSPVILAAFDGIRDAIADSFGSNQQERIKTIADAINDAAIVAVGFGETAVTAGGIVAKEWYAIYKVVGDVIQILDLAAGGFKALALGVAEVGSAGGRLGPMASDVGRISDELDAINKRIAERGVSLQAADAAQQGVDTTAAALSARLADVRAKMEAARDAASSYVGPLQGASAASAGLGQALGKNAFVIDESEADFKKFAEALKDVTSAGQPFYQILQTIDGNVVEAAKNYLAHGAALEKVATVYKLTEGQINAVNEQMKLEQTIVDATNAVYGQLQKRLESVAKLRLDVANTGFKTNLAAETSALQSALDSQDKLRLTSQQFELLLIQRDATAKRAALDRNGSDYTQALNAINAETDEKMGEAARAYSKHMTEMEQSTSSFAKLATTWLQSVPDLLQKAFTGGGGLSGAFKALTSGIGGDLGADAFGRLAGKLSNTFANTFGTGVTAALGTILPGIGSALGALGGALFGKLFNDPEKQINPVRQAFIDSFKTITPTGVIDGLTALEEKAKEAGVTVNELLNAKNADQYQKAIDNLNVAFAKHDALYGDITSKITVLQNAVKDAGGTMPADLQQTIAALVDMTGLTDDQRAAIQGLAADAAPNYHDLTDLANQYGVSLEQLGPKFEQAHIDETAKKYTDDFNKLSAAGADTNGLLAGMGDEFSKLVQDSQKFGTAIPENMKNIIQALSDTGNLVDENGNKIKDLTGLKWEDTPLDKGTTAIVDAIKELKDVLEKIPGLASGAAKGLSDGFNQNPVDVRVRWDIPSFPAPPGQSPEGAATGGLVTSRGILRYFGRGGLSSGTDTVPAMLTPGELILNAAQQNALATSLRSGGGGDMSGVEARLESVESLLTRTLYEMPERQARLTRDAVQKVVTRRAA